MTEAADEPEVEEGCSRHTTNREQGTLQLQGRSEKGSWAGYLKTSERQQTVKTAC